jgi:hypothetical protein
VADIDRLRSPVAPDRGGIPADFGNFVTLMRRMRERLNATGRKYGVSITLVCVPPSIAVESSTDVHSLHHMFVLQAIICRQILNIILVVSQRI